MEAFLDCQLILLEKKARITHIAGKVFIQAIITQVLLLHDFAGREAGSESIIYVMHTV